MTMTMDDGDADSDDGDNDDADGDTFTCALGVTSLHINVTAIHSALGGDLWQIAFRTRGALIPYPAMRQHLLVRGGGRLDTALQMLGVQLLPIHNVTSKLTIKPSLGI